MKRILILTVFSFFFSLTSFSQTEVNRLIETAIFKMDNGDYLESILLLKKAENLEPKNAIIKYEMAYAYYKKGDYKKSIKILKRLIRKGEPLDYYYQMLGNAYDMDGNHKKALNTYSKGISRFSNSGKLYLETGNIYSKLKDYNAAIKWYEQGVEAEPNYPSNYFWLAHLFLNSDYEVWGLIYGEIFMLLEPGSRRTSAMSEMLYNTYKSEIAFSDSSSSVSFYKTVININYNPDNEDDILERMMEAYDISKNNESLPWGGGVFEPTLALSLIGEEEINIASLNRIRSNFVDIYYNKNYNEKAPLVLLDFHKKIKDAGHFEAYNYWLLSQGNISEFNSWAETNKEAFDAFAYWINNNFISLDDDNKFLRLNFENK